MKPSKKSQILRYLGIVFLAFCGTYHLYRPSPLPEFGVLLGLGSVNLFWNLANNYDLYHNTKLMNLDFEKRILALEKLLERKEAV